MPVRIKMPVYKTWQDKYVLTKVFYDMCGAGIAPNGKLVIDGWIFMIDYTIISLEQGTHICTTYLQNAYVSKLLTLEFFEKLELNGWEKGTWEPHV